MGSLPVRSCCTPMATAEFTRAGGRGIALAVPEAPLEAREKVIELATEQGLYRAASFASGEMEQVRGSNLLEKVDLLAMNQDEARRLAEIDTGIADPQAIVESAITRVSHRYPNLSLSVTAGAAGSWSWDGEQLFHVPAIQVPVATTGGAGDAHLSGIIAGLAVGAPLATAHRLGVVTAAASVTSPHTIHRGITRRTLADLAIRGSMTDEALLSLLR